MTLGSEKCFKLYCPDCLAKNNKKTFKTWALLKNHMQWGYDLPGHKKRSIQDIMQIIFNKDILVIDGRGRKKKQKKDPVKPGAKPVLPFQELKT